MKNTFALLAAAASLAPALATSNWGDEFCSAPPFPCPGTNPGHCNPQQSSGWTWTGLPSGPFSSWGGFDFNNGWSCGSGSAKRGALSARGSGRSISATCGHDVSSAPSFSCGADSGVDSFSIDTIDMSVDFDCRMEFHYGMPDGSTCKQTSDCSSEGSTITNTQCGGAKSISFVFPEQSGHSQSDCGIHVHHIGWNCGSQPSSTPSLPGSQPTTECSTPPVGVSTPPVGVSTPPASPSTPAGTPPPSTPSTPAGSPPPSSPSTPAGSPPPSTPTVPVVSITPPSSPSSPATPSVPATPSTHVTTYQSTSTVFTTTVRTITSCASTITNCPAGHTSGILVTTETIAISTTICPVTATMTHTPPAQTSVSPVSSTAQAPPPPVSSPSAPASSPSAPASSPSVPAVSIPATTLPPTTFVTTMQSTSTVFTTTLRTITSCGPTVTNCPAGHSTGVIVVTDTIAVSTTICPVTATMTHTPTIQATSVPVPASSGGSSPASGTSPATPSSTMPCPSVVPQCLNTWLHLVSECKDNTDASCYCPSEQFVDNVFECLYAHGESDNIVSEAVKFFQGLCAKWVPTNPGLVTGVPSCISPSATPAPTGASYTTVYVDTTVTVPCVTGGVTIPGSSTVQHISTAITVPQVSVPSVVPTGANLPPPVGATTPAAVPPASTFVTAQPTGTGATGGMLPTSGPTSPVPVTAGAANVRVGMGLAAAVMAMVAAL